MVAARHAKCLAMAPSGGAAQPSNAATARHETFAKELEEVRARLARRDRKDTFRAINDARRLVSNSAAAVRELEPPHTTKPIAEPAVPSRRETECATTIQACWRGNAGRQAFAREIETQEAELEAAETAAAAEAASARTIQTRWRRKQAAAAEVTSAQKIQARWRGKSGRQEFLRELEEQEARLEEEIAALGLVNDGTARHPVPDRGQRLDTVLDASEGPDVEEDERPGEAEDGAWADAGELDAPTRSTGDRAQLGSFLADQQRLVQERQMDTAKEYLPEEGLTKQKQPQISRSGSMKLSELKKAQQQGYRGSRSSQSLGSPAGGSQRAIYMAQSLDSSAMTQSMDSAASGQSGQSSVDDSVILSSTLRPPALKRRDSFPPPGESSPGGRVLESVGLVRTTSESSSTGSALRRYVLPALQYCIMCIYRAAICLAWRVMFYHLLTLATWARTMRRSLTTHTSNGSTESRAETSRDRRGVHFKPSATAARAGLLMSGDSYRGSQTAHTSSMLHSFDSGGSYSMMVLSNDTDELKAFAAKLSEHLVCQIEYSESHSLDGPEVWRAFGVEEQAKIKKAMKLNTSKVNLGDKSIDLGTMTWSNSWTTMQNLGKVRVKAINNYVGKEAAVCTIQKAWQESRGLGNVSYMLERKSRFSRTILYRERYIFPATVCLLTVQRLWRHTDTQNVCAAMLSLSDGPKGFHPSQPQARLVAECREPQQLRG